MPLKAALVVTIWSFWSDHACGLSVYIKFHNSGKKLDANGMICYLIYLTLPIPPFGNENIVRKERIQFIVQYIAYS